MPAGRPCGRARPRSRLHASVTRWALAVVVAADRRLRDQVVQPLSARRRQRAEDSGRVQPIGRLAQPRQGRSERLAGVIDLAELDLEEDR
jgi:hypothetical protein